MATKQKQPERDVPTQTIKPRKGGSVTVPAPTEDKPTEEQKDADRT